MTESLSMSHLQLDQEICLDKINMALYLSPELRRPRHVTKLLKGTLRYSKVLKSHQLRSIQPPNPSRGKNIKK